MDRRRIVPEVRTLDANRGYGCFRRGLSGIGFPVRRFLALLAHFSVLYWHKTTSEVTRVNDKRTISPYASKSELIKCFNTLTGPELMNLSPEEKSRLLPVAQEIVFPSRTIEISEPDAWFDSKEKALVLLDKSEASEESLKKHIHSLSVSIWDVAHHSPGTLKMELIRDGGLKGTLKHMVGALAVRKKKLPDKPSTGMMAFCYISAFLMAAAVPLLLFHPGISAWFTEAGSSVLLTILTIIVSLGALIATGSFLGCGIGFLAFAGVTWLLNKLIPLNILIKVLTLIFLGFGALLMFIVGKDEAQKFREGKDREYAEATNALRKDIEALRPYVRGLKEKARRALDDAEASPSDEYGYLRRNSCKVVVFYYTHAEDELNKLLENLS